MTDWLNLAKLSYDSSTSYVDNNFRKKWEDNLRMFQSKHPADSKYNSESYKHRSKIFRPKFRSAERKNEAAAAAAFFANQDVVNISATNPGKPEAKASADILTSLMNYRLTKTIPWFQTLIGGLQDAQVMGVVCSYQSWKYRDETLITGYEPVMDEFGNVKYDGENPVMKAKKERVVKEDKPSIELIPIENIRIDPGASWIDPVGTSPYFIWLMPMYVCDVKTMFATKDDKTGQPKWKEASDGVLRSAINQKYDSTRQAREGKREDSKQADKPVTDFEIVWVHLNIIKQNGEDSVFYTIGTEHLLSDPKPLKEVYFHGERPFVMGMAVIETHKAMPSSLAELGDGLQREANEIVNQRLDNVKLVLNKRWIVKRGSQVDLKSLVRNVPGSVTLANETGDVQEVNWPDVTGSAFQEQDRINVDYDELLGNFSSGSVMTNRKMGETVGGMGMIAGGANQMTEYLIRTFSETWVEPVLKQLVKLEQAYETDQVVLTLAAEDAQLFEKYGVNAITDDLLNHDLTVTVNVGMGATDPNAKMQKFMGGMSAVAQLSQIPGVNKEEISKEIFGLMGYKDGKRFFGDGKQDPEKMQMQQVIQQMKQQLGQMQQALQGKQQEEQSRIQLEREKLHATQQSDMASATNDRERIASQERIAEKRLKLDTEKAIADQQMEANKMLLNDFADRLEQAALRAM